MDIEPTAALKSGPSLQRRALVLVAILAAVATTWWAPRPSTTYKVSEGPIMAVSSQLFVTGDHDLVDTNALDRWQFLTIRAAQLTNLENAASWLSDSPADRLTITGAVEVTAVAEMAASAEVAIGVAGDLLADALIDGTSMSLPIYAATNGVGGASAGLIYTLAMVDSGIECDLTGGRYVTGTGSVSADGTVGPIAGVRHKALAAEAAGADVFLSPVEHVDAVTQLGTGLEVVAVARVTDALDFLAPNCVS